MAPKAMKGTKGKSAEASKEQIIFGKWNPHTVQKSEIAGLVGSFQGMYVTEVKGIKDILILQINVKAQDAEKIDEAELQKWNKSMKKEKDMLEGIIMYGGQWLVSLFNDRQDNKCTNHDDDIFA
ncbi:hypothetical protein BKA83DRAFT_4127442 [Pisolithus microcarpus]|nr:hypothetical protein BKA83DRAFT_4127442 [Pisolithus microcarpus]